MGDKINMVIFMTAIGVIMWGFTLGSFPDVNTTPTRTATKDDAQTVVPVICEMAVKDSLKSPRSAKFPWVKDVAFDGKFAVLSSYVDATNSFGAEIRTNYVCSLQYSGGDPGAQESWNILNLAVQQ